MAALRILFAEDHEPDMELALRELRREGLEFEHRRVETRTAYMAELGSFRPDVVVTDYSMPAFTGMEALALSLEQDAERPVILFTGSINEATAVACLKAGAADYILKEHLTRLPFAVREALEQRDLRRARSRAEEDLRLRTEELRRYFENSTELLGIYDLDGRALRLSPSWEAVMGIPAAELEGRSGFDFFVPEDHAHMATLLGRVLAGEAIGGERVRVEGRLGRRDLEFGGRLSEGRIYMSARDVTDRLRAEQDLREARSSYENILDSISEAVYVQDQEGRFLHVNRAVERMYGYPRERLVGESPALLSAPGRNDLQTIGPLIARAFEGEPQQFEFWGLRADGSVFPKEVSLTAGTWQGQDVVVAVARDISERVRNRQAMEDNERTLREITQLLASRGGDYETNVQAITSLAGQLLKGAAALYNRMEADRLCTLGRWQAPDDLPREDDPHGHLCHQVVLDGAPLAVPELRGTPWEDSDPAVGRYGLRSYLGLPVRKPDGAVVGSLCVVWGQPNEPDDGDLRILGVLAQALQTEEAHRQAAEALRQSEDRLGSIFRVAPVGISLTRDRVIHELNDTLCRITGYGRSELLGQSTRLLYASEEDWQEVGRVLYGQVAAAGSGSMETCWRRKDGSPIRVLISVTAIDPEHLEAGVTSAILDVSERRQAEQALQANESFMRAVLESSPLGISVRDRDGRLLSCNKAWQRIWAMSDEVVQFDTDHPRPGFSFNERDDYSRPWWDEIRRVYTEGGTLFIPEAKTLGRRPGSATWVAQHFYAIPDEQGQVDRIVVLTEDISERKRAEEALRQSEAHYRRFFENDLTADYISGADGMLQDCNPAYLRLFGFASRDEALATPVTRLYPDPAKRRALLERLQREQRLEYEEAELRDIKGEPVHVIMNVLGIFDSEDRLDTMQGYLFDITQYKALQLQFHQAQKMESIGRLAGGVAHDFNNLLTVINGHVEILRGQFRAGDPVLEQLDQVGQAGERAARLTRQLLAFSRRQVLQLEPVALNEIVADMHRMLQRLIGEDVHLETDLARGLPGVLGDTGQLEQVVVNLAVNARDAMPDGGDLLIRTRQVDVDAAYCQTHRPMTPGRYCQLEVADTGTGMGVEVMARIFEPFFTTKEKGKGTGLGLATVYGIVKQIGGFIWAESALGQGTTFRIFLPALEGEAGRRAPGAGATTALRGSERVLVVEDEEMVRKLAVRVLKSHGYEVLEAVNGRAALDLLDSLPAEGGVALVLSDVIMPVMGGRELMEQLRRRPGAPQMLFMSGYTEESIARQGILELGAQFIQKPFDVTQLLRLVREALDAARSAPAAS